MDKDKGTTMTSIDTNTIQTLITIATQAGIQELEVTYADTTVRITCYSDPSCAVPSTTKTATHLKPSALVTDVSTSQTNIAQSTTINAPMLGTLYHKADPDAKPFVKVGQAVKKGDTLCIVEAMKMMHEVKADTDGVITEILVDDGAMVEYDQPLFGFLA